MLDCNIHGQIGRVPSHDDFSNMMKWPITRHDKIVSLVIIYFLQLVDKKNTMTHAFDIFTT